MSALDPPSLRAQFEAEGFVVIPGFLPKAHCAQLRTQAEALVAGFDLGEIETTFDTIDEAHARDRWFLDSGAAIRPFLEPERDRGGARRVNKLGHALHELDPQFRALCNHPDLARVVQTLAPDMEPLLLQSMVIFKPPRVGGVVPPHQDSTYLYTEPNSVIGLWLALDDASGANGCLEVLPGAHREGLRKRYRRRGDETWTEVLDARPWPREGWRALPAEVGTLVAFDGLLPHRSAPNRSASPRCAFTLHAIDARAEYPDDNWLRRPTHMPLRGFESQG